MKRMKKLFAILMTMAMVMGLGITGFAASYSSNITVKGLAAGEEKTVNLYAAITLNEDKNQWVVADWADPYIDLNVENNTYVITNPEGLSEAVEGVPAYKEDLGVDATEVTFNDVAVGAYVITASGNKATYAPMVAETYNEEATYMEAEDVTVIAKTSGYEVGKEANDNFVGRGDIVTFTITTTFPSFQDPDAEDNSYKIIDNPVGLDILDVTKVTIGGTNVTLNTGDKQEEMNEDNVTTKEYTINLSGSIGTENANAGKKVVVEYTAMVMTDKGYSNTANASRNDVNLGTGSTEEKGFTGNITFTKYAENGTTVLSGAEFTVAKKDAEGTVGETLYFIKVSDGVYKAALNSSEDGATQTLVATNGTLYITGLNEGTYHFTETKAPEGYSINTAGKDVIITANETENVSMEGFMTDTKLSALPSTGGMGTTLFTIAGCVIMISAAGLFFATRKKSN